MKQFKILNLYAGIGGNRKLWDKPLIEKFGNNYKITAIEYNKEIAAIYKYFFPNDEVIVTDAHQYLLEHFKEYDFIWSSPPCQSHSITNHYLQAQGIIRYPDLKLYEEIIFIKTFFKGKYTFENVKPYYDPLIYPSVEIGRHLFWSNFTIPKIKVEKNTLHRFGPQRISGERMDNCKDGHFGFFIDEYKVKNKEQIRRNCVDPIIALHILNRALEIKESEQIKQGLLFK